MIWFFDFYMKFYLIDFEGNIFSNALMFVRILENLKFLQSANNCSLKLTYFLILNVRQKQNTHVEVLPSFFNKKNS